MIVWVPRELPRYSTLLLRSLQGVDCTQYMTTGTAILDIETDLNQYLEEIAKKEAPSRLSPPVFPLSGSGECFAGTLPSFPEWTLCGLPSLLRKREGHNI